MPQPKPIVILTFIIILACTLRLYRFDDLAVFLADQAADSTAVLEIMRGNPTLLGPVSSVGGFFNGPIVYYLMLPFYLFLKGDPIAGTFFQIALQLATIPFIFILGHSLKNEKVGLIAAFLFTISPLMVDYSRMEWNPLPAIFFSTLIITLLLRFSRSPHPLISLLIGIAVGWIVQMHYFASAMLVIVLLFPFVARPQTVPLKKYYLPLISGIIIGLAPYIMFELRHNFFNLTSIMRYLTDSGKNMSNNSAIFTIWPIITGQIITANNVKSGIIIFLATLAVFGRGFVKKEIQTTVTRLIFMSFIVAFIFGALYGGKMNPHYVIIVHTSLIVLTAYTIYFLSKGNTTTIIFCLMLLMVINAPYYNLDKPSHPSQDGLTIADFKHAAKIIKNDEKSTQYNVAMHAQGDNRAMPLRYTLNLLGEIPITYEDYGGAQTLYFLLKKSENIAAQTMWEYTSFGKSQVVKMWEINENYDLLKLEKLR